MNKTINYQDHLIERLKNPNEATAYLNAALEDQDLRVFLMALNDVAGAYLEQST